MPCETPTIRGVLFDAGNTLIRVAGSVGEVYAEVARRYGVEAEGSELESRFRSAFVLRKRTFLAEVSNPHSSEKERAWWRGLVQEVFEGEGFALEQKFTEYFEELYETFQRPEVWQVFPDVSSCLDELGDRGVPLGVVSNWDSRLHAVLRGLGLAEKFRFVLTSAEFGEEKPHPSIFREAARRLGLAPENILHVGDLVCEDVEGPLAAGMKALWIDREGRASKPRAFPCRAKDLDEVLQIVSAPVRGGKLDRRPIFCG